MLQTDTEEEGARVRSYPEEMRYVSSPCLGVILAGAGFATFRLSHLAELIPIVSYRSDLKTCGKPQSSARWHSRFRGLARPIHALTGLGLMTLNKDNGVGIAFARLA